MKESDLGQIKTIFWTNNIVALSPHLNGHVTLDNGVSVPVSGTWFDHKMDLPTGEVFVTGEQYLKSWWQVDGEWPEEKEENSVLVGKDLAASLHVKKGDTLYYTNKDGTKGSFTVSGILTGGGEEDGEIIAYLPTVQKALGLEGKVDTVTVSAMTTPENELARRAAANPKSLSIKEYEIWYCTSYVSSIAYQIEEVIHGSVARPVRQIAESEGRILDKTQLLMLLITVLSLLSATMGVSNLVSANIMERSRELGLLKALGATDVSVIILVLSEIFMAGLAGGVLGYFVGIGYRSEPDCHSNSYCASDSYDPAWQSACDSLDSQAPSGNCSPWQVISMNIKRLRMYLVMVTNALLRRKLRMFIALLAVAIGATIISGMITVYKEVPEQMGREFRAYGANLLLLPANGKTTMEEAAVAPVYDMLKDKEIIGAAPFLYERLKINESPVLTGGTDFNEVRKVSPYWQINGEMPKENSKEILLGYELSERFQAKPGSQVIVALGDGTKEETYTVSGIVRTGGKEEQFAYVDIKSLWDFLGKPNLLSMVQVSVVANSGDLEALAARMAAETPDVHPQTVKQIAASEQTVLGKLQALVLLVTVVVLLLTLVCVGTTMTEVVSERRREIGLKKALGATNRNIAGEFFGESCMLGFIGGIIGTGCGYLFALAVGVNVFGRSLEVSFPIAIMTIILSIVVTAVATMLPVRTAVKVEPAIVLRGE